MKKIITKLLVIIMILSAFTIIPFTANAVETSGDFNYEILDDGTVEITDYNGNATVLEIPNYIEGKKIISIGDFAFSDCINLMDVNLCKSVIRIGRRAFSNCTSLESINIPDCVTSIGYEAFSGCTKLKSITIPDNVVSIGYYTFSQCKNLENVSLGTGIKSIGFGSFEGCASLNNINIPDNVISIGWNAFGGCKNIKSVTIPDSVISIEDLAFRDCTSLIYVKLGKGICDIGSNVFQNTAWYDTQSDGIVYIDEYVYGYKGEMPEGTSITIEEGTKCIAGNAFNHCTNLIDISIPDSVINIGSYAFYDTAWYNNQPDGLVYLGKVFYKYKGEISENSTIILEDGIKGIADDAFTYTKLESVFIPNSVISIGEDAFYGCSIENIDIPDSVTYIGNGAFANCASLKSISLSKSLTHILSNTFYCCYFLNDIIIPNSVTFIDSETFANCDKLKSITIPNSVMGIGQYAFGYSVFSGGMGMHYIKEGEFTISSNKGTAAETYANENGFKFIALDEKEIGDVNGDGILSVSDATLIQKYAASLNELTPEQLEVADFNGDGTVNVIDATAIQKKIVSH